MGFNFGAFAAGALEGAGDLMEKQHKETKDTIDKNMTFAYQQGLPFHRARKEKQRKLEGYASDLSNMQLSADQVSVVMGKSEKFISDFIDNSIREKKNNPKFDISSQVTVKDGGKITAWQDVQMGTADLSSVPQQQPSSRKSLFSSMAGTGNSASNSGFGRMKDRAQAEMEGITGASYNDVTAAAGGYYNYEAGSEGTVTMTDSAAANAYEGNSIQLQEMRDMSGMRYQSALWEAKDRVARGDIRDKTWEFTQLQQKWATRAGEAAFDANLDTIDLQDKLDDITYRTRQRKYGNSPEQGMYAIQLALSEEQMKPDSDPERVAMLQKSKMEIGVFLGEMTATKRNADQTVSFGQWNDTYESRVQEILALTIDPGNPAWYFDEYTKQRSFDFSLSESKEAGVAAKAQATSEFIQSVRDMTENNIPVSTYLKSWMYGERMDVDLISLPASPIGSEPVDPKAFYAFKQSAVPKNAKAAKDESGRTVGYTLPAPQGYVESTDGPLRIHPMPKYKTFVKITGKQLLDERAKQAAKRAATQAATKAATTARVSNQESTFRDMELATGNTTDQEQMNLPSGSSGTSDPWDQMKAYFSSKGKDIADAKEATAMNRQLASNNNADATVEEFQAMTTLFGQVRYGSLSPTELRAALEKIAVGGFNYRQITYAQGELAKLDAQ